MSFDGKSKENQVRYCSQCFGEKTVEHVCSSQSFSDSLYTLSELANEQLTQLDQFALTHVHLKCQEDLEAWHSAAVNHLGEIFQQRLVDLERIFKDEIRPNLQTYRLKMIEQLKTKIIPRMNRILDEQLHDDKQIERIQTFVHNIRSECDALRDGQWIHIQLPDIKNFSVPIRIAKMALAARLTDGEKDPLEKLSEDEEEENAKKKRKEKKINAIDPLEIFATNRDPFKAFALETNSSTLALSNQFLLVHDQKKLLLFDFNKQIQQFDWNDNDYGILVDICWMSSLSVFVILTIHSVYLYDPLKRSSSNLPTKVESIKPLDRSHVLASLCPFERDLYINYHKGVHIDQYRVSDSSEWTLHKRYSKSECAESKDVGIRDVRCDQQHLCLSIMQHEDHKWRLDLMSRDMVRVRRGVPMDAGENQHKFFSMLIPLQDQRWLFVNWFTNKLWIVDQQGKTRLVKESQIKNIRNTCVSPDMSMLAIRTEKPAVLKIYKLD